MSWPLVNLSEVALFQEGPGIRKWQFRDVGIKLINVKNIVDDHLVIENSDKHLDPEEVAQKYAHFLCDEGDLVMASSGATWGKTAWVAKSDLPLCMNTSMIRFKAKDKKSLDIRYLRYYLKTEEFRRDMERLITGSAQPNFGSSHLKQIEVPLPPISEQKRIAAILDKADAIRRKRQQAIQLADEFLRAVFLDMFGDPVTNPKGWEVKPLSSGINSIVSGWSAKGEGYPCKDGELGVLKISAVTSGKFKPEENKFVRREDVPEGKNLIFPKKGDLLFSRANTRELVAATCIVPSDEDNVFLPDKFWKIKTDRNVLIPEFLNYLIWQPRFKERLTAQATGTSGSMLNISKEKFESTESIFPPVALQEKFKSVYWDLQSVLSRLEKSEKLIFRNFHALSQKAFSGEL